MENNCLEEEATPGESGLNMAYPLEFVLEAQKKWVQIQTLLLVGTIFGHFSLSLLFLTKIGMSLPVLYNVGRDEACMQVKCSVSNHCLYREECE